MCFNTCVMGNYSEKIKQFISIKSTEAIKFKKKVRVNLTDLLQRRDQEQKQDRKITLLITSGITILVLTVLAIINL